MYGAFARCTGAQTPEANGCVAVTLLDAGGNAAPPGSEPAFARFDGIAGHFSTYAAALVSAKPGGGGGPGGGSPNPPGGSVPTAAQIRGLLRKQIVPHGRRARIGALLKHGYRLPLRALVAGSAKVEWYRLRKGAKPILVASGHRAFGTPGTGTVRMKLKPAGRRLLRRATRIGLLAKGTFTPAPEAPVKATRRFTLRR